MTTATSPNSTPDTEGLDRAAGVPDHIGATPHLDRHPPVDNLNNAECLHRLRVLRSQVDKVIDRYERSAEAGKEAPASLSHDLYWAGFSLTTVLHAVGDEEMLASAKKNYAINLKGRWGRRRD